MENTRVGQITDYDKLTLEVWTDGTISAKEAVRLAARIMTEHLNLFVTLSQEAMDAEDVYKRQALYITAVSRLWLRAPARAAWSCKEDTNGKDVYKRQGHGWPQAGRVRPHPHLQGPRGRQDHR